MKDFAKKVKLEDMRIDLRKKQLAAKGVAPADDAVIAKHEEAKQRWNWLALRTARDSYLQHFGKIGSGDVLLLEQEIEKEESPAASTTPASKDGMLDGHGAAVDLKASPRDGDGDVKMES